MSEIKKLKINPILGALNEIANAMSSLQMFPSPIDSTVKDTKYLSENDRWANHAMQHLTLATEYLKEAYEKQKF